jgi:RHS repeat-associated protein
MALVETKTFDAETPVSSPASVIRYQLDNNLGSASLLDKDGAVVSYEEYYPYGSSSYQAGRSVAEVSLKHYRYTGKERDEETGLYYYGARYYVPWIGRWTSCDPKGMVDGPNLYMYTKDNPIKFTDPNGTDVSGAEGGPQSYPNEPQIKPSKPNKAERLLSFIAGRLWKASPVGASYHAVEGLTQIPEVYREAREIYKLTEGGLLDKTGAVLEEGVEKLFIEPLKQASDEVREAAYSSDAVEILEKLGSATEKVGNVALLVKGGVAGVSKLTAGVSRGSIKALIKDTRGGLKIPGTVEPPPKGLKLTLSFEEGFHSNDFRRKGLALQDLAERNQLSVAETPLPPREKILTDYGKLELSRAYKMRLIDRAREAYGVDFTRFRRFFDRVYKTMQGDHVHELQLKGADALDNLWMLDAKTNVGIGRQIRRQLVGAKPDTPVTEIIIKGPQRR